MKELIAVTFGQKINTNEAEASTFNGEFNRRFSEEKPPNKRTGMRGDRSSIRMFNQEGAFSHLR